MPTPELFEFTLELSTPGPLDDGAADALFEAGCDDSTVSSRGGRVFLDFDREAATLADAVRSAIADVRAAGVGNVIAVTGCDPAAVAGLLEPAPPAGV